MVDEFELSKLVVHFESGGLAMQLGPGRDRRWRIVTLGIGEFMELGRLRAAHNAEVALRVDCESAADDAIGLLVLA